MEAVERNTDDVVIVGVSIPFELDQLLDGLSFIDFKLIRFVADSHEVYSFVHNSFRRDDSFFTF